MKIIIKATDRQWEELAGGSGDVDWIRVTDASAFLTHTDASAYMNLEEDMILPFYGNLQKPVLINSVAHTLAEMQAPANVYRINGWPGFLSRTVWELAGHTDDRVMETGSGLGKKFIFVTDEPGFVAARVIAMVVNEAYFALADGVSSKPEIDTAMKLGTNYPYGPFEWASMIGTVNIAGLLLKLNITDIRYTPSALLLEEAKQVNP